MNVTTLNMTTLDGNAIIKKGGGVPINNQDKVVDITENGTTEVVADGGYTGLGKVTINTEIEGAKPKWTGHADAEGLKAIGWTDEDIAYYQAYGVNWNEEDDEWHKVTDDNKALYGVLTASNISTYKDRIVYLPKIDTSGVTNMSYMFKNCTSLTAIPMLDTSNVTNMDSMFYYCYALTTIPMLDTSKVRNMYAMFSYCSSLTTIPMLDTSNVTNMGAMVRDCYALTTIPMLDTSNVTNMSAMFSYCSSLTAIPMLDTSKVRNMYGMFYYCYALTTIPMLDTSNVTNMDSMFYYCYALTTIPMLDTSKVRNMYSMFYYCSSLTTIPMLDTSNVTNMGAMVRDCYALTTIPMLDTSNVTDMSYMFRGCYLLIHANLKNVKLAYDLSAANLMSKDSLLYIINNEAATSAITIKLASYAYDKWATDPDIVAALANHPNISISK